MIVVDSSVLIAWFRNQTTPQTELLDRVLGRDRLLLGDLVLMELLQGARSDTDARRIEARLSSLDFAHMVDRDIAVQAAAHFRKLRSIGIRIRRQMDLLIGTFCIAHRYELLHADRDFQPMARHLGLRVAGGPDPLH